MSLAEITAEVSRLSSAELEELHAAVEVEIAKKRTDGRLTGLNTPDAREE